MGEGRVLFGEQRRWKGGMEDIWKTYSSLLAMLTPSLYTLGISLIIRQQDLVLCALQFPLEERIDVLRVVHDWLSGS
jgi:hypothetical protein